MANETVTKERRKEVRKRPLGLVYVELSSANGGMLRDLSESGFAMRAMMPLRTGESTPFSFSLDPETRLSGECRVSWVEEGGRVAGLEFTAVPRDLPGTVRNWLLENSFAGPPSAIPVNPPVKEVSTLQELRNELRSIAPDARTGGHVEKKADPGQPNAAAKFETTPKASLNAGSAMNVATQPVGKREQVEQIPVEDALPPAQLEPLPAFSDMEVIPDLVRVNRGYARSGIFMAIRMMIVLALIAGAVVYRRPLGDALIWLGQKIAGSNTPEISYAPNTEGPPLPQAPVPAPVETSSSSPSKAPAGDASKTAGDGTPDNPSPAPAPKKSVEVPPIQENTFPQPGKGASPGAATTAVPVPTTNRTTTYSAPPNPASDQAGQLEYLSAQDILKNRNSGANLPEAVRLLWIAVEKGNSNAEISLAELYREGHGVMKSCDQTKILLTAAAKRGNAEGQKRLNQFLKEGCE